MAFARAPLEAEATGISGKRTNVIVRFMWSVELAVFAVEVIVYIHFLNYNIRQLYRRTIPHVMFLSTFKKLLTFIFRYIPSFHLKLQSNGVFLLFH